MKKIGLFLSAVLLLLTAGIASAQQGEVSGVVLDEATGEPVPFASVMVKGTMNGVAAGPDGFYVIRVADKAKAVLVISSVGYKDLEVPVAGRSIADASLKVDNVLEDVVVVAYGTVKKEAVTGSVSSVKGEGLPPVPVTSVDKMLTGKLAGVNISSESGQPGSSSQIRIRGTGSINASNAPLWVVDGIPVSSGSSAMFTNTNSTLTALNPNDIESITVLKDAAAAAAYGSRAANGVILVTTKSGKAGKSSFDARAKFGVNWLQSDSGFRMMNGRELLDYYRQATVNAGLNPDDPANTAYYYPLSMLEQPMNNWLKFLTRKGNLQEYEVSGRGGNSKGSYFSSFSYQKNQGIAYGIDFEKMSGRVNASYKLLKNLETGLRLNLSYSSSHDVPMQSLYYCNPVFAGETLLPWIPTTHPDGSYNVDIPSNSYQNPRRTAQYDKQYDNTYSINGLINFKWTPIAHLDLESKNAVELIFLDGCRYWNPLTMPKGMQDPTLQEEFMRNVQLTTSNTATYSNLFGRHSVRALLGQEAMKSSNYLLYANGMQVDPDIPYLNTADQTKSQSEEDIARETMLSYFGIFDYNYDNRYFAQANVRRDGSSLFGSDRRWGTFWSASASWNLSNEKFWKVDEISLLKLRLSYGVNGNNGIGSYLAYGVYSPVIYNGVSGYRPSQPNNSKLSWEKNKTWNVGLDFGFLDNRISGQVDVYQRKTVDMLLDKKVPQTSGWSAIFTNVGSLKNTGVELQLNADIIRGTDMLWSVGANAAFNKTKILDLAGAEFLGTNVRQVPGKSMYTYYLYDYYGVNPTNGEALWVHENEDGTTSLTNDYGKARRHYCGSPEPKVVGGFNTDFQWKGLSLGVYFEYKAGNKVWMPNLFRYLFSDGAQMQMNQVAAALDYWKEPGDIGITPKPVAGNATNSSAAVSDRWVFDASYLRLKDVTLSYSLPEKTLKVLRLKGLRVYVSGLNLYCFNDIYDFDPEMGVGGLVAGAYPLTKSFVGGIEVSF